MSPAPPREAPRPAAVSIAPSAVALSALGETAQLTAEIRDQFGNPLQAAGVTWSSADAGIATVDANGLVTAVANGETTVAAAAGQAEATVSVIVRQVATGIAISLEHVAMASFGDTVTLVAAWHDARGNPLGGGAEVEWSSADAGIATVDADGLVTAVANGETTVTAAAGQATATASVIVRQVATGIAISLEHVAMASLGDTATLSASPRDARGNPVAGVDVEWSSADAGIATVDADGLVTAVANGETTVTAAAGQATASASVTVRQTAVGLDLSAADVAMASLGDTATLSASPRDARGNPVADAEVEWSSADAGIATVDADGLVTAVANGETTVTAAAGQTSASASVTVRQVAVGLDLSAADVAMASLGDTATLSASPRDARGNPVADAEVEWSSADAGIATVDADGLVTAVANGETTVTAAAGQATATASVAVSQIAAVIAVSPEDVIMGALGDTATLSAAWLDARGNPIGGGVDVEWSSADPGIATVDADGLITAVAYGETVVTAAADGIDGFASVTVLQVAASLAISPNTLTLAAPGNTARLSATVLDAGGVRIENPEVAWSTSDAGVATVDATGLVTAVGNGRATITATSDGIAGSAAVTVGQVAASLTISPDALTLAAPGNTARLSATVLDAGGVRIENAEVAWSTSDAGVATVDATGLVTAVASGGATVTATSDGIAGSATVTVGQVAASLTISPNALTLAAPGNTARLSATVRDAGGVRIENAGVAWSTSDAGVATVDATGLVTAVASGETTVTATSGAARATVAVTVRSSSRASPCVDGTAGIYPCSGVDLLGWVSTGELRPGQPDQNVNDVWGWTDSVTGTEYALVGRSDGVSFVDLSDPEDPQPIAFLPSPTDPSSWRDVKVYGDYAYVVADAADGHGMLIFDLTRLRGLQRFTELARDGRYTGVSSVHNIAINQATGFAYMVGSNGGGTTCGGGLHMVDLSSETAPSFAGCHATSGTGLSGTGYTHDVECVTYAGPDATYSGREICVGANETHVVVSDVTDKAKPKTISTATYPNVAYAHQGQLDEQHRYFYLNDEFDESNGLVTASRLLVWDLEDLDDPVLVRQHLGPNLAIDHNLYVDGDLIYYSNYTFGMRVLDISDRDTPVEHGFFDTVPGTNQTSFQGSWSNYPYFRSGIVAVTSMGEGLFVLRLQG